jgi:hypothetical protein
VLARIVLLNAGVVLDQHMHEVAVVNHVLHQNQGSMGPCDKRLETALDASTMPCVPKGFHQDEGKTTTMENGAKPLTLQNRLIITPRMGVNNMLKSGNSNNYMALRLCPT